MIYGKPARLCYEEVDMLKTKIRQGTLEIPVCIVIIITPYPTLVRCRLLVGSIIHPDP